MFAQLNGPKLNVLLDLEPIRPEEAEATAALRLLGRMRRVYGVRFFDALTIDAWYVQGPFLKAVEKLGWGWEVVLKQERMEVFQEARQLSAGQKPVAEFDAARRQRHVPLWDVKDLTFTESYGHTVSVVHSHETWTETKVLGGKKTHQQNPGDWRWMLCDQLKGYPPPMAYEAGLRIRLLPFQMAKGEQQRRRKDDGELAGKEAAPCRSVPGFEIEIVNGIGLAAFGAV